MKIMDSTIVLETVSGQEQFDLSYSSISDRQKTTRVSPPAGQKSQGEGVLVDRVSISSSARESWQKNYISTVTSATRITSEEMDGAITREQIHAVENLINGLIDRSVFLQTGGQDTSAGTPAATGSGSDQWQMTVSRTDIYYESSAMAFGAQGSVITEDGRTIDFSLLMEMEQAFALEYTRTDRITIQQERVTLTDPLIINLSGKAPELTDMTFSFDLNSDGRKEQISFLKPGSGFLVFDKNNDGKVDNGSELFGPNTGNGFEELAAHDEDRNNWIDENDAVFSQLYVWTKDDQGNDLLISLKDAGIGAIYLSGAAAAFDMKGMENTLLGKISRNGVFLFENGNVGSVQQVDLAVREGTQAEKAKALTDNAVWMPLPETMELQSNVEEENQKKMVRARLLEAQRFTGPVPEPENRFKTLLDMVEKLKKDFEATLKQHHPGQWQARPYARHNPAAGFIPSAMDRISYRL